MTHKAMPQIDLSKITLTPDELSIVKGIINTRTGELRASKPQVDRHPTNKDEYGRQQYEPDLEQGKTAYVWRMVAFMVSPIHAHQCMPCTAEFDVPYDGTHEGYEHRKELVKELDKIVDKVVDSIPVTQWHGVARWSRALGGY